MCAILDKENTSSFQFIDEGADPDIEIESSDYLILEINGQPIDPTKNYAQITQLRAVNSEVLDDVFGRETSDAKMLIAPKPST